jgi:hypothetical protein
VFKRYNSFLEGDLREAAHRFNTHITLTHRDQNLDIQKSSINQRTRP